ncbi:hypothetical protein AYK25_06370 [Thermoplasmatales archaeon SM1-50]|nr:MAG: hypothetical protein AYK25_06370 [Thermoplasmatales archaeon SM1-50]
MGDIKTRIGFCIVAGLLLTVTSIGQGIQQTKETANILDPKNLSRGGSIVVWQDDFFNLSKVDTSLSNNIIVNTTVGTVIMQHTYAAWIDPGFTRMKEITVINNGQETFQDYNLNITVVYDPDMQFNFFDLRFTNETGVQLPYYRVKATIGMYCELMVKIPTVPPGQTTIYMFYGNQTAVIDKSNFSSIFSWADRIRPDTMVSFKSTTEGAWDPSVIYGANRFLVTWEERLGPEDIPLPLPNYERTLPGVIHGRTYDKQGTNPIPTNNSDIDVSTPGIDTYHAENPCNAFGSEKFFVVWEENPANQPLQRYEADIKGAMIYPNGTVERRFSICTATGGQFNPQVVYDNYSNRFLVVWADARNGENDYDVRGRLYNYNGYPINVDFQIAYEANYQGNPWICSDDNGMFFIVYEDGPSFWDGPFSLFAYRYDYNGNRIGNRIPIALASETSDYIFPAVSYNPKSERYFITWNDGNISGGDWWGNIWGKMLNKTGGLVKNNYIIELGTSFIRSVSVPYFDTMFFIAYDGIIQSNHDIYGRMIAADGTVMTSRQELSDGSSQNVDWNDIASGAGRIFVTWEDERDLLSQYADVFQYVWHSEQSFGSLNVTTVFGDEKELITSAQLMSVVIEPELFRQWRQFCFLGTIPSTTTLLFDIMDQNGSLVLKADVQNGQNISDITASAVRLRATFSRISAHRTPVLDKWNISALVGKDIYPPSTEITLSPSEPDGNNDWYVTPVTVNFTVFDVDSDPENITTYYDINGYGVQVYNPDDPPVISSERPNNYIEYWSNDSINEELPHHLLEGIKIDLTAPMITLYEPSYTIPAGNATINGTVTEYTSGSGVDQVKISVNGETIYNTVFNGESKVWFEWEFIADLGETYDIYVEAWDKAGNKIEDRRTVVCPDKGLYSPGYIYWFDYPKIGPIRLLVNLDLSIAIHNTTLYVVLPSVTSDAVSVKFVAMQLYREKEFVFQDTNLSNGCSTNLQVPVGFYHITAYAYDDNNNQLEQYTIITKMFILLIK